MGGIGFASDKAMDKRSLQFLLATLMGWPSWAGTPAPIRDIASVNSKILSRLNDEVFKNAESPLLNISEPQNSQWLGDFDPQLALKDPLNRISKDFHIPEILMNRTQFWFDIYTKYGNSQHVIHHVRYPWIVFEIVDTSDIENNPSLHKWTKYHRAKATVNARKAEIRKRLRVLSKRRSFSNLKGLDKKLYEAVAPLRGKRAFVFQQAASNVRSQLGQKDFLISGLGYAPKYLPYMEEEFKASGLPVELTRIPFVESSFNPHAQSKVGASGIWQIMPRTGRAYVTVNDNIDERNSPLKASLVAAEILQKNYKAFNDWPLAVTAYNHGIGGLRKNLRKSKSNSLVQLINRLHSGSFRFASANFYASFLAVLHAERYHNEIFKNESFDRKAPIRYSVYRLDKNMRAKKLVTLVGVDEETFLNFNLDLKSALKKNSVVPKGHVLLVPFDQSYILDAKLGSGLKPMREARQDRPKSSVQGS